MPLFSAIIPLYNKRDTIGRALQSVVRQKFKDFELIVVDDGSTDGSNEIVREFFQTQSPHIGVRIIQQKNSGVSAARNRGVQEARGTYVAFLDADDEWHPDFLTEITRILDKYPHAKVMGVSQNKRGVLRDRVWFHRSIVPVDFYSIYPFHSPLHTSATVILRKLFLEIGGYDINFSFYEDDQLLLKLARNEWFFMSRKQYSIYHTDANVRLTSSPPDYSRYAHMYQMNLLCQNGNLDDRASSCINRWITYRMALNVIRKQEYINNQWRVIYPALCDRALAFRKSRGIGFVVKVILLSVKWRIRYWLAVKIGVL